MKTRVMAAGDLHCGSAVGLTPPEWQYAIVGEPYHDKFSRIQKQMWDWFEEKVAQYYPIDRLILNGDAIDGKGQKSGGTEQITTDRIMQGSMVERIVKNTIKPRDVAMTFGTNFHTGIEEDMETPIAKALGGTIESHLERTINGVRIDARHFVGGSSIPYNRHAAVSKEDLWRLIWADRTGKEKPHVVLRSHVHYYGFSGNEFSTAFTLPCLQGLGNKFGSRICSGTVSIGFLIIDCEDGEYSWKAEILPLAEQISAWKAW